MALCEGGRKSRAVSVMLSESEKAFTAMTLKSYVEVQIEQQE